MKLLTLSARRALRVSYLPQLKLTFKLKTSKNQSAEFWGLLSYSILIFLINGIQVWHETGNPLVAIPQAVNLVFSMSMLVMVLIYPER